MSISATLEMTRASHEDIEQLERLILNDLRDNDPQKLSCVRYMIHQIMSITHKLVEVYEKKENAKKDEIEATLGGQTAMFYHLLKEIREYYRCHPTAQAIDNITDEYEQQLQSELPQIKFSGEEGYGRYLDMHELHRDFVNSKFGKKIDYSDFIDVFPQLQHIPSKMKMSRPYMEYLSKMLDYLVSFLIRTEPLRDVDRLFTKVAADFESGWKVNVPVPERNALIDLHFYCKAEELVEIGPEKLKQALGALGLKMGGTVQQRAERLFLTKDTPLEKLDKKHFSIGARKPERKEDHSKDIALMEVKIKTLCDILSETINRTKENIERKQALTCEEMEKEREEPELVPQAESDDEEQQTYNPLKIPMGWDGKPIPLWLYKLHGLGQEFMCEICGNHSYRGRRAYERHFMEFQHQNGMRRLGIPNSKDFSEITSIEEAHQLWGIIQAKQAVNKWRPELEKEYEDEKGNIYNQKTYTDLLRQGLIHPTKRRCIKTEGLSVQV